VIVIAVVVVLIFALTGGSDTSSPEGVARAAVDAINDQDTDALKDITCDGAPSSSGSFSDSIPAGLEVKAELGEVKKTSDTEATATITMSIGGDAAKNLPGGNASIPVPLKLANKDGKWCVAG
jgi:hypothetical protein